MRIKKYRLNIANKDLTDEDLKEESITLDSLTYERIYPLEFGGFLAFESDTIHCFKKNSKFQGKLCKARLRNFMSITGISPLDKFNKETGLTEEGNNIMRYIFGSNTGELYLLVFNLNELHLMDSISLINPIDASRFMILEFMACKLPDCSSLVYIDNGLFFYGSRRGESSLISL